MSLSIARVVGQLTAELAKIAMGLAKTASETVVSALLKKIRGPAVTPAKPANGSWPSRLAAARRPRTSDLGGFPGQLLVLLGSSLPRIGGGGRNV